MIQITHRFNAKVLHTSETATDIRTALEEAVQNGANLRFANLSGDYLRFANLSGDYLRFANLSGDYLR
jgi:uncharacterized protein YjbI with pentapeptide repeats